MAANPDQMKLGEEETPPKIIGTSAIAQRIAARYAGTDYACLFEVANGTGGRAGRSADAVVMNLWPSRGLEIEGFEFKVSRSDWIKELQDPSKADALQRYCDRWWIVVGDSKIVKPDEMPSTWGLMVPHGDGLRVAKPAPKLTPIEVTRDFLASMLRRATDPKWWQNEKQRIRAEASAEDRSRADKRVAEARQHAERPYKELAEKVRAFEVASGIEISRGWQHERIGKAVQFLMDTVMKGSYKPEPVADAAKRLRELADQLVEMGALLSALAPKEQS
jgi:hypothetical protein